MPTSYSVRFGVSSLLIPVLVVCQSFEDGVNILSRNELLVKLLRCGQGRLLLLRRLPLFVPRLYWLYGLVAHNLSIAPFRQLLGRMSIGSGSGQIVVMAANDIGLRGLESSEERSQRIPRRIIHAAHLRACFQTV